MEGFKLTEEKVHKLIPVFESILSRHYGKRVILKDLSIGGIKVYKNGCAE